MKVCAVFFSFLLSGLARSASVAGLTVTLDNGTFTGLLTGGVVQFLGIPFAQPPYVSAFCLVFVCSTAISVGNLRYRLPQTVEPYSGNHLSTAFGPACPQQNTNLPLPPSLPSEAIDFLVNAGVNAVFPDNEDCELVYELSLFARLIVSGGLTINVINPLTATPNSKLPVAVVSPDPASVSPPKLMCSIVDLRRLVYFLHF